MVCLPNLRIPCQRRLRIALLSAFVVSTPYTNHSGRLFGNLLMMIDKEGTNRAEGREAAEFLRKSGLQKNILKTIWLMAAKTDPSYLVKILRIIENEEITNKAI